MTYELNYYPTEKGDGIIKVFSTKAQAVKEFKRLEKIYNRCGDAYIKVWEDYGTWKAEPIRDIDL